VEPQVLVPPAEARLVAEQVLQGVAQGRGGLVPGEVGEERRPARQGHRGEAEVGAAQKAIAKPPDGRRVRELLGDVRLVEHVRVGDHLVVDPAPHH
jgi:hypothetical protein